MYYNQKQNKKQKTRSSILMLMVCALVPKVEGAGQNPGPLTHSVSDSPKQDSTAQVQYHFPPNAQFPTCGKDSIGKARNLEKQFAPLYTKMTHDPDNQFFSMETFSETFQKWEQGAAELVTSLQERRDWQTKFLYNQLKKAHENLDCHRYEIIFSLVKLDPETVEVLMELNNELKAIKYPELNDSEEFKASLPGMLRKFADSYAKLPIVSEQVAGMRHTSPGSLLTEGSEVTPEMQAIEDSWNAYQAATFEYSALQGMNLTLKDRQVSEVGLKKLHDEQLEAYQRWTAQVGQGQPVGIHQEMRDAVLTGIKSMFLEEANAKEPKSANLVHLYNRWLILAKSIIGSVSDPKEAMDADMKSAVDLLEQKGIEYLPTIPVDILNNVDYYWQHEINCAMKQYTISNLRPHHRDCEAGVRELITSYHRDSKAWAEPRDGYALFKEGLIQLSKEINTKGRVLGEALALAREVAGYSQDDCDRALKACKPSVAKKVKEILDTVQSIPKSIIKEASKKIEKCIDDTVWELVDRLEKAQLSNPEDLDIAYLDTVKENLFRKIVAISDVPINVAKRKSGLSVTEKDNIIATAQQEWREQIFERVLEFTHELCTARALAYPQIELVRRIETRNGNVVTKVLVRQDSLKSKSGANGEWMLREVPLESRSQMCDTPIELLEFCLFGLKIPEILLDNNQILRELSITAAPGLPTEQMDQLVAQAQTIKKMCQESLNDYWACWSNLNNSKDRKETFSDIREKLLDKKIIKQILKPAESLLESSTGLDLDTAIQDIGLVMREEDITLTHKGALQKLYWSVSSFLSNASDPFWSLFRNEKNVQRTTDGELALLMRSEELPARFMEDPKLFAAGWSLLQAESALEKAFILRNFTKDGGSPEREAEYLASQAGVYEALREKALAIWSFLIKLAEESPEVKKIVYEGMAAYQNK